MAAVAPSGRPGRLLLLVDVTCRQWFLVDTGSAFSLIPHTSAEPACGPALVAADRSPIKCWGKRVRTIVAAGNSYKWTFLLAAVSFPIIGSDFLEHFDLMVDLKRRRLVHGANRSIVPLSAPPPGCCAAPIGVVAATEPTQQDRPLAVSPLRSTIAAGVNEPSGSLAVPAVGDRNARASTGLPLPSTPSLPESSTGLPLLSTPSLLGPTTSSTLSPAVDFPEVVHVGKQMPTVKHHVEHVIETTSPRPISSRYRRLDPEKLEMARQEFLEMERQGIVRRSNSSWSSPLHMVAKADGTWRPCGDYRRLNLVTKPDLYPPPHMEDLSARLAGMKIFSKLDLRKGYYQVPVAAADVKKTAIITPFGLFEFLRMPFGLRNAGQSFQRFMDEVLQGLEHVFVYLDDILVASPTAADHQKDLHRVFSQLKKHGLILNNQKCVYNAAEVEYLGHLVTAEGISPLPASVAAIADYPPPSTRGELQRFLGMLNYYRRFMKDAASTLKPLTDATRGQGSRNTSIEWGADRQAAFKTAKAALLGATVLAHPDPHADINLAVDASNHHVGAVLQQETATGWRPLAYFSRKLNDAESRYSTYDRELLACVAAIRHFRFLVEGRKFYILSDHRPLCGALHRLSDAWCARQQRHLAYVAEYTSEIRHVSGVDNVVADALSRPPAVSPLRSTIAAGVNEPSGSLAVPAVGDRNARASTGLPLPSTTSLPGPATEDISIVAAVVPPVTTTVLDWSLIAEQQRDWAELQELQKSSSLKLKEIVIDRATVWCDTATDSIRPLIPPQQRRQVFAQVHELAHAGTRATTRLLNNKFVWPGLARDVKEWCRECVACQRAKVTSQPTTTVTKMEIPQRRFSHVHVDLVGPMPISRAGHRYLLTMIDRSTRWFEAVPLGDMTAELVLDTFVATWVARFGVPERVTTDRGTQFTSSLWSAWCVSLNVQHITTTAFHPQANGMVERLHRQIKDALRARGAALHWSEHLPWVLMGIRAAPKDESGVSAAEVTLGQQLILPGLPHVPLLHVKAAEKPTVIPATRRSYAEVAASPTLDRAEFVYVKRGGAGVPLSAHYEGPYRVVERGPKFFKVKLGEREDTISRDRLKPHLAGTPPAVAEPPSRGRPRRVGVDTFVSD